MTAPDHVPVAPHDRPRRPEQLPPAERWFADRPGDFVPRLASQPRGPGFGIPGPDQGYALTLAERFRGRIFVATTGGETIDDAIAGCLAVALKRAAHFGRAPVIGDLELAFTLWGFLDPDAPADLTERRRSLFGGVSHHYSGQRAIVDLVPESTLVLTPRQVRERRGDWRSLFVA